LEDRKRLKNRVTSGMGNAWHIGTFFGIPVKIHWSFGLLLLFITYTVLTNGFKFWQGIGFAVYVFILFFCVVLHEYGHALTARKFGVVTKDIILSPIGGIARLENMPQKPIEEFFIAIAGPLVNLVIGTLLLIILYFTTGQVFPDFAYADFDQPVELLRYILWINLMLFLFNLIPAFPMDGGRILRSLLATKIGKVKATKFASSIGKVLAVCFVIYGVFDQQLILALIGLFIFMMAGQEYDQTKVLALINNTTVGDIMRTSFTKLHLSDTYATVIEKYYREGEQNFLVFDSMGNISGTIPELFIKDTIKDNAQEKSVNQMMSNKLASLAPDTTLKVAIETMRNEGVAIVSVEENGVLVGVLDRNGIENFLRMKSE
jgi:Zn-dependent protease/predicted transcriptional regulator